MSCCCCHLCLSGLLYVMVVVVGTVKVAVIDGELWSVVSVVRIIL